jgi:hypothetical protein
MTRTFFLITLFIFSCNETRETTIEETKLIERFGGADAVLSGVVTKVGTQHLPGYERRPITVVTLENLQAITGAEPRSATISFWTWKDSETGAAQLQPGTEIAVGLIVRTGRTDSYMLSHPHGIAVVDGDHVRVPHRSLSRSAFAASLNGGAQ